MKLIPEDLQVVSFETDGADALAGTTIVDTVATDPNDPTPATYCFVCD